MFYHSWSTSTTQSALHHSLLFRHKPAESLGRFLPQIFWVRRSLFALVCSPRQKHRCACAHGEKKMCSTTLSVHRMTPYDMMTDERDCLGQLRAHHCAALLVPDRTKLLRASPIWPWLNHTVLFFVTHIWETSSLISIILVTSSNNSCSSAK